MKSSTIQKLRGFLGMTGSKRTPIAGQVVSVRVSGNRCRVIVDDGRGTTHHLLCSVPSVKVGQMVKAGQVVGKI